MRTSAAAQTAASNGADAGRPFGCWYIEITIRRYTASERTLLRMAITASHTKPASIAAPKSKSLPTKPPAGRDADERYQEHHHRPSGERHRTPQSREVAQAPPHLEHDRERAQVHRRVRCGEDNQRSQREPLPPYRYDTEQEEPGLGDRRVGKQPHHVILHERGEVAVGHREDGEGGDGVRPARLARRQVAYDLGQPEDRADLRHHREEGRDGDGRPVVGARRPEVERRDSGLVPEADEYGDEARDRGEGHAFEVAEL